MAWTKSSQSLIDLFTESLPDDPRVERRKMFGYPCAFANGHMFAGLFQDDMFARLPAADRAALEAVHGPLPFEPMPGRPMKDYSRLPEDLLADENAVAEALAKALRQAAALPPKVKKAKKAKEVG